MMFDLDPKSPVPLYLQLAAALRRAVVLGALRPGDRVPTVRELAARARVNRNTAARAVQHLEAGGLVRTRVGQGTFVEEGVRSLDRHRLDAAVDAILDRAVSEAHGIGAPLEELGWRLSRRIEAFRRRHEEEGAEG